MSDVIDITTLDTWVSSLDLIRRREDLVWASSMGYLMSPHEERELNVLDQFVKQGETVKDWHTGTTVIADVGWERFAYEHMVNEVPQSYRDDEYVQSLVRHLDWKSVIEEMQAEYVDFTVVSGVMPYLFWVRG